MKVAVSINSNGMIAPHLGRTKLFFIFEKNGDKVKFLEKRESIKINNDHIIDEITDCKYVISGKIGDGMVESLKKDGIKAIIEEDTFNPKEAVEKLKLEEVI